MEFLKEIASQLGAKTEQIVLAEAEQRRRQGGEEFYISLNLRVPSLEDYRYELFCLVQTEPATFFPLAIPQEDDEYRPSSDLQNQSEFEDYVRWKLSSNETKNIIRALIAQAKHVDLAPA